MMAQQTMRTWWRGVLGAAISAGAGGVTVVIVDPLRFNLFQGGARELASVVIVQAIVGAALYLKTHQIPVDDGGAA